MGEHVVAVQVGLGVLGGLPRLLAADNERLDGIASVRAMVAIATSVREGRPVTLAEAAGEV